MQARSNMADLRKLPTWQVSTVQRTRAHKLRRDLTDAERIIWNAVRAGRMHGAHFRRQAPIGPFIVDFVCHDTSFIIEVDGGQHFEPEQIERDRRRTGFLASKGFRILRFNNHDVLANRQGVLETIAAAVVDALSPPPLGRPSPA